MSQTPAIDSFQASSWHGSLQLGFARQGQVTQLIHNRAQAPLKVQRPFYPEGSRVCHAVILHTAGGMVGGDRLGLDLQLNPHAQALLTTAAAGKVYRSQGLVAKQSIQIQVAAGACLEWLPQETIVFNGALYQQDLRVELAPGATWLGWEITRLGRTARGEHFLQGSWRSRTEIWQQGSPLWIDSQWLQGGTEMLTSPHGLAGQPVVATLAWIGPTSPDLVTEARRRWTAVERQGEAGVTCLSQGLLCRYRGFATGEARHWFIGVWQLLRLCYLQRSACPPRVWQI
ncbi:MAG TPA: urease accessory protein UreD [Candidatus Caenarcaniphilales bacterium]